MFKYLLNNNTLAKNRLYEEKLYAKVAKEMASGYIRNGLWAKAFSQSKGSEDVARSIYIKLRVQSLEDEIKLKQNTVDTPVVSLAAQMVAQQKIITSQVVQKQIPEKTDRLSYLGKLKTVDSWAVQQEISMGEDAQEIIPPQLVKEKAPEKIVKACDLSQLKSSIMRDEIDNIRKVFMSYESEEFEQYLPELLELADLFDANESKGFLLCYQKENNL